jgi:hypothetical protein
MNGKAIKGFGFVSICLIVSMSCASGQFKSQENQESSPAQYLVHPATSISSFFGFFNPDNFMMRHNFSFSYLSAGGSGLSLAAYTNSMFYKISNPLNVRFDVTLQGSPFGQYGSAQQSDLSKLYLSRAELNYHPSENFFVKVQYNQMPFSYWGSYPSVSPYLWGEK